MLGSQLGVGAYRALVEERLNGVMVSVSGQLQLNYVPFEKLVDPETLVTVVRYVRARLRLPQAGPVSGNVRERVARRFTAKAKITMSLLGTKIHRLRFFLPLRGNGGVCMNLRRSLCFSFASVVLLSVFPVPHRLASCVAGEASEIPPELRRVVIREKTVPVFDGKHKLADATWGERYGVSQQQDGWLWVESKDGVAKKRFIRGWIKRESIVPEEASEELFLAAQRERPNDPLPPLYLALKSIKKKDADQSLLFADEAVRLAPSAPLPHVVRSQALMLKGDFDQAHAECLTALKMDPPHRPPIIAWAMSSQSKSDRRKRSMRSVAQERDPFDPAIAHFLAWLFGDQQDWGKAKQAIDKAIRLDPACAAYYYRRSVVNWKIHDVEAAFKDIAIAERLDPDDADNKICYSMLLQATGDMRAAYREAIRGYDCQPGFYDRPRRLIQTLQRDDAAPALTRLDAWRCNHHNHQKSIY